MITIFFVSSYFSTSYTSIYWVVTNYYNRNLFSHRPEGKKSELNMAAELNKALSRDFRREPIACLLQFLVSAGVLLLVAASLQSLPNFLYCLLVFFCINVVLSFIRILVFGFMAHPNNTGWSPPIQILNHTCKNVLSKLGNFYRSQWFVHGHILEAPFSLLN